MRTAFSAIGGGCSPHPDAARLSGMIGVEIVVWEVDCALVGGEWRVYFLVGKSRDCSRWYVDKHRVSDIQVMLLMKALFRDGAAPVVATLRECGDGLFLA